MWNMTWLYDRVNAWLCVKSYMIGLKGYISGYRRTWHVYAIECLVIIVLLYSRKEFGRYVYARRRSKRSRNVAKWIRNEPRKRSCTLDRVSWTLFLDILQILLSILFTCVASIPNLSFGYIANILIHFFYICCNCSD